VAEDLRASRGLHHFVVAQLGELIASGELAEETQIVPEEIATRFGASRPVVREALRVLEAKGMVRPRPKTGTRVLPVSSWNLLDRDVIRWRAAGPSGAKQLGDLSDLRAAVEIVAAGRCASEATADHLETLRQACDRMEVAAKAGDLSEFTAADVLFHTTILEASGNEVFQQFADPFAAFLHAREELHTLPEKPGGLVIETHRRIVAAIEAHDGTTAEALSRDLIQRGRDELDSSLSGRRGTKRRSR